MAKTISRMEIRGANAPEETRSFEKGRVELVTIDGRTVGRATFEPGWKWSTCVGPIAKTEVCMAGHFGYQLSGTMRIASSSGEQTLIRAGDFFSLPPGHDAWVEGDETVVMIDFQGLVDYAKSAPQKAPRRSGRRH